MKGRMLNHIRKEDGREAGCELELLDRPAPLEAYGESQTSFRLKPVTGHGDLTATFSPHGYGFGVPGHLRFKYFAMGVAPGGRIVEVRGSLPCS